MRFNKNGISKIKEYYKNDFEEIFLNNKTLIQLKKDKSDKITSLILHLAKCKVFLPIKLMYMFKYKKEREHLQK